MDTFNLDDSLSEISPKQYREFRLLYNELLGYIERDETDKIAAVSQRLDNALEDSLAMMVAIDRRLTNIQRQKNIVQKTSLHHLFRFPKTTIEVSHAFPLAPLQPSEVESSTTPVASEPVQDSGLEKAREMEDLMKQMATYNRQKSVDAHVAGVGTVSSDISEITKDQPATSGEHRAGYRTKVEVEDESGVSLRDEFTDESLYIKSKPSADVDRSANAQSNDAPPNTTGDTGSSDQDRKARIWDYIDQDKKSGGISHDL